VLADREHPGRSASEHSLWGVKSLSNCHPDGDPRVAVNPWREHPAGLEGFLGSRASRGFSAFGSIGAVVRAHAIRAASFIRGRTPAAGLGDLILAGWKLAGTGLAAVGVSGLVVSLMNTVLGRAFTGHAQSGVSFGRADCARWMALWPGAHTCAGAQLLEASSDAVVLRVGAGLVGGALLVAYGAVRYVQRRRRRGPAVVLAGYFPLLAACVFGAGALGLALARPSTPR
jgi:hypothetical protein